MGGWGGGCGGYGMGMGGGYGGYAMGGWGGCYGGYRMGMGGGCGGYGMGMGGGYGGCGGYSMGWGGYGRGLGGLGYGGFANSGISPVLGNYASSPLNATPVIGNYGTPLTGGLNGAIVTPGTTQSFYSNPAINPGNEATLVVHVPEGASLTVDGQPTQSASGTRIFHSPPLQQGKTYTYTLRAELNRDGRFHAVTKDVEVRAGQRSEVTLNLNAAQAAPERIGGSNPAPATDEDDNVAPPVRTRRTPPRESNPGAFPAPPRDR